MQGQFPCPHCGKPILVMIYRKGAVARCLWCGARAEVPDRLEASNAQEVLTELEASKRLTVEQEFEQLSAALPASHRSVIEKLKVLPGIELGRQGRKAWFLAYEAQSPSQFSIEVAFGFDPFVQITVFSEGDYTHFDWMVDGQPMTALEWFSGSLSGKMRLIVYSGVSGEIYHDVEVLKEGGWERLSGGRGCFLLKGERVTRKTILENRLLPIGEVRES